MKKNFLHLPTICHYAQCYNKPGGYQVMQVKQVKQVSKNIYIHYIIKIVKGFLLVCALP